MTRTIDLRQALAACTTCAAEIRLAAMGHGADLDEADRRWLFALATVIERRATAAAVARGFVEQVIHDMIAVLDALDAPGEDLEPSLGAPERHPTPSFGYGCRYEAATDQTWWASGADTDEREDENEHGTVLDRGELDEFPRRPRHQAAQRSGSPLVGGALQRQNLACSVGAAR